MSAENIKKEINDFQKSVQKLSVGISKASLLWKDEKFIILSSSIGEIANQSKDIIVSGDRLCSSIEKLEKIATEKY